MPALFEILAELVSESGVSQTFISSSTGVDKADVSRILKGKRPPKKEFLEKLFDILCLPEITRLEVLEQLEREKIGPLYDQHMAVNNIITRISQVDRPHYFAALPTLPPDTDMDITNGSFSNSYDINRLVESLFSAACKKGQPFTVRICCPFEYTTIFDIIWRYHVNGSVFSVEHMVRLEQRSLPGTLNNLEIIGDLVPFNYAARDFYTAYYYYGSGRELDDIYTPYPYYLIIDNNLVLLSRYFSDAVLVTDSNVVKGFNDSFNYCVSSENEHCFCTHLISYTNSADNIYDYFARQVMASCDSSDQVIHVLMSTPPLCPVFSPEQIAMHARTEIPEIAQLAENLVQLRHYMTETATDKKCLYIFSLEGLDRFLETGETIEYPPTLLTPFTPEERLLLLDTYMQLVLENDCCFVADSFKLAIPANIMARTLHNGTIDFLLYDTVDSPYGMTTITFTEKSLHSAFMSFCEYIPNSPMVLHSKDAYECLWRRREIFAARHGFE